jgi:uncharacterized protein DUF6152
VHVDWQAREVLAVKFKLLTALGGLLLVVPALAHHSFMAEFDQKRPVVLTGVVTRMEWQNPHTYFSLDVKDADGKVENWRLETGSPGALTSRGWKRETMKPGDHVVVNGYRSKDAPHAAAARSVTLADGRTIFAGQTDDGGPVK